MIITCVVYCDINWGQCMVKYSSPPALFKHWSLNPELHEMRYSAVGIEPVGPVGSERAMTGEIASGTPKCTRGMALAVS